MPSRFYNFQGGTITNNPLSSGGTTLNSAALEHLPAVSAPDTVTLVLDPEAANGDPEVVIVTAHTAQSTSATITRAAEGTSSRQHPSGTAWVTAFTAGHADELPFRKVTAKGDLLVATGPNVVTNVPAGTNGRPLLAASSEAAGVKWDQVDTGGIKDDAVTSEKLAATAVGVQHLAVEVLEMLCPAGTIRPTIATTADDGWLLMGQSISNADTTYPYLWAKAPSSWKSGTTLNLPSETDLVLRGATSGVGDLSGANTVTLATANLPSHTHTINHDHPSATTGNQSVNHTHNFSATTSATGAHNHGLSGLLLREDSNGAAIDAHDGGAALWTVARWGFTAAGNHTHTVSGTTSGASATHNHTFDVPAYSGNSGSTGSGSAFSVQERGLKVRWQIKAH